MLDYHQLQHLHKELSKPPMGPDGKRHQESRRAPYRKTDSEPWTAEYDPKFDVLVVTYG